LALLALPPLLLAVLLAVLLAPEDLLLLPPPLDFEYAWGVLDFAISKRDRLNRVESFSVSPTDVNHNRDS
jgi:hypothetical protein